jgi:hypothetical protein
MSAAPPLPQKVVVKPLIHTIYGAVKHLQIPVLVAQKDSSFLAVGLLKCLSMASRDQWKSAADILSSVLPNLASAARLQGYRVWEVWEEAVGRLVARKAQPSKIQRGKLFVTVSNSAYLQEMQFYKARIRDAVNQRLGAPVVKDIFFVLGRVREATVRPTQPPRRPLPPFEELTIPKLDRPELEAAFSSLLAARRRRLKRKPRG